MFDDFDTQVCSEEFEDNWDRWDRWEIEPSRDDWDPIDEDCFLF